MNWDAFGAVGEVVGATAVIITLFFVGVQIRSAKLVSRNQTFSQIFDGVSRHVVETSSPQFSKVVINGLLSYDSLEGTDRLQFDSVMQGYLNYIEATLSTAEDRLFDDRVFEEWGNFIQLRFAPYQGFREWWTLAQSTWPSHVVNFIDEQISLCNEKEDFYKIKGTISDHDAA
jgi:hypothetical protein